MHQPLVVVDVGLDKDVILGPLGVLVVAVYKKPLEPGVPHAAGVAREIHPRWEVLGHQTGRTVGFRHGGKHDLRELRALLEENDVIRLTLILQEV